MGDKKPVTAAPALGRFPRICDLVNIDAVPKHDASDTLGAIAERMVKPLDDLWALGEKLNKWDAQWRGDSQEEQWARAISELLTGTAYFGPNIAAFNSQDRKPFYKSFCSDNPAIAIVNPCETLATYLLLSRGYEQKDLNDVGLDSGDNSGLKVFKENGGKWNPSTSRRFFDQAIASQELKPGSCYGWQNEGNDKSVAGPHVVGVLRVDETLKQAQIVDTGAAQNRFDKGAIPFCVPPEWEVRGNYDNLASKSVNELIVKATFRGLGTPGTHFDLAKGLERLKKARPFGLARLFVATEQFPSSAKATPRQLDPDDPDPKKKVSVPNSVVFMSRLIRMWGAAETENYSIMRCQWALRSLPKWTAQGKELPVFAWWVFYSPMHELATLLLDANRATRLDELKTTESKEKLLSRPFLTIRTVAKGLTQWDYVLRALSPSELGKIPAWMKTILDKAKFNSVINPDEVPIPAALNDGLAWAPPTPTP